MLASCLHNGFILGGTPRKQTVVPLLQQVVRFNPPQDPMVFPHAVLCRALRPTQAGPSTLARHAPETDPASGSG